MALSNAEKSRLWRKRHPEQSRANSKAWREAHKGEHYTRYGRRAYWANPKRHFLRWKKSWLKKVGIDVDQLTPEDRSRLMSKIRSVSMLEMVAKPFAEVVSGARLRAQPKDLFGNPDYANKTRKVAVFLHGCFWHQPCPLACATVPKSNSEFWEKKFRRNAERHNEVEAILINRGWQVLVIWEHELKDIFKRRRGELVAADTVEKRVRRITGV